MLDQPSLRENFVRPAPPFQSAEGNRLEARVYTMQPAPNQQHLAVIWRSDAEGGMVMRTHSLRVYAMSDGKEVAAFDLQTILAESLASQLLIQLDWSSTSSQLLFRSLPAEQQPPALPASRVTICCLDGSHKTLPAIPKPHDHQAAAWSADRQYIYLDCNIPSILQVDGQRFCSSIWQATTGTQVFSRQYAGSSMLMGLPAEGVRRSLIQQPWDGLALVPRDPRWTTVPSCVFTLSSRAIVAACQPFQGPMRLPRRHLVCLISCGTSPAIWMHPHVQ